MTTTTIQDQLAAVAHGLNMDDADDRAAFRTRLEDHYRDAKLSVIRADIRELAFAQPRGHGPERVGQSRADALRLLSGAYIIGTRLGDF